MAEGDCVRFWEFEIKVKGESGLLVSNPVLLNLLCVAFARHSLQVVIKITTNTQNPTKVCVITKGEEAEEQLLCDFSYKTICNELKDIGSLFPDISIESVKLIQAGIVLGASEKEFQDVENDTKKILENITTFTARSELILSKASMVNDSDRIISEHLTSSAVNELLKSRNIIIPDPDVSPSVQSAIRVSCPSTSAPQQSSTPSPSASPEALTLPKSLHVDSFIASNSHASSNGIDHIEQGEPIVLRPYQVELAQPGLKGQNCIVLAPTGSGKTIVAAYICKKFIEKQQLIEEHRPPIILFLVPRIPLVEQQYKVFRKYLGNVVFQVSGSKNSSIPPSQLIQRHRVSVMTPQILHNEIVNGGMKLENIDLLIFDECHHVMKNHVCNQIMRLYMDKHLSDDVTDQKLPQILGLSASLKVLKAKTEDKAKDAIMTLMANLNVTIPPVQAVEHRESLQIVQNKAGDEIAAVVRHPDDAFANNVKNAMNVIECMIKDYEARYFNVLQDIEMKFEPEGCCGSQEYEAWVVVLLDDSKLILDRTASLYFMSFAIHLRVYNDALVMNDHVRSSDVKEYLDSFFDELPSNEANDKLKQIYRKYEPRPTVGTNPLLEKLRELLSHQYEAKPHSRCIVFVRTRAIAKALINYLSEQTELVPFQLNSKLLTGTNAKRDEYGMTKAEQEHTLNAFKSGVCKVLVSTSVAEEGLDIQECNLIVTYNYSTNEVGKVQRKGRGRAKDSRFVILAYTDSGIVLREKVNDCRVELASLVLEKIQNADPLDLKLEIVKLQVDAKIDRDSERKLKQQHCANDDGTIVYKLLCVGCKRLVTTSEHIQRINEQHHVVVDPQFQDRVTVKPIRPPYEVALDVLVTGTMLCNAAECKEKWGSCMSHKRIPVYVLTVGGIIVEDSDGKRFTVKKWNKMPFYSSIPPLDPTNIAPNLDDDDLEDVDYDFLLNDF